MYCTCFEKLHGFSIAVSDFFKFIIILGVKLVSASIILLTICQMYNETILDVLHQNTSLNHFYITNKGVNL